MKSSSEYSRTKAGPSFLQQRQFVWYILLFLLATILIPVKGLECYECVHTGGAVPEVDVIGCDSGMIDPKVTSVCEGAYCLKIAGMARGLRHIMRTCADDDANELLGGHNSCEKINSLPRDPTLQFIKIYGKEVKLKSGTACVCSSHKCNAGTKNRDLSTLHTFCFLVILKFISII